MDDNGGYSAFIYFDTYAPSRLRIDMTFFRYVHIILNIYASRY